MRRTSVVALSLVLALVAGVVSAHGLHGRNSIPEVQIDQDSPAFAPGDAVRFPVARLLVTFLDVAEDNRCEGCRAGGATIAIRLTHLGEESEHKVSTMVPEIEAGDYLLRLVSLDPMPVGEEKVAEEDYRLVVRLERRAE